MANKVPSFTVYFGESVVGELAVDDAGRLSFDYDSRWRTSSQSFPISVSLPLESGAKTSIAGHAFFVNLLPEGHVREMVVNRLGLSVDNDVALLRALGGECAGALSIRTPGQALSSSNDGYQKVSAARIAQMARAYSVLATVVGDHHVRLSLAGAQDKLPIRFDADEQFWLPTGGAATTHILKVPSRHFKHLPANEWLIMKLAQKCGLGVADVSLLQVEDLQILLIDRFDRVVDGDRVTRLHQEDICQALGKLPSMKYESEGGPTIIDAMGLIRRHSVTPLRDAQRLLQWLAFNLLAGNSDGHGKNVSFYRIPEKGLCLTPFYDLVCTRCYPGIDRHLAMSIGSSNDPGVIGSKQWSSLALEVGVGTKMLLKLVTDMAHVLPTYFDDVAQDFVRLHGKSPAIQLIRRVIKTQCRRSLEQLRG